MRSNLGFGEIMSEFQDYKLFREPFMTNLVIVTGLTSAGKSMLAPIVSSFKHSEKIMFNFSLEQYPMLNYVGKMTEETAIYLIRYAVDFMFYDNMIGRNANLRPFDETSIWNTGNPGKYFKRLFADEGTAVLDEIREKNPILVLAMHNAVWHSKIYFQAFPSLKMLHCQRHPIDIVHRWYKKGFGSSFYYKPRNGTLTFKWNNKIIPYHAFGWEEEYTTLSEMDSIIHMIHNILLNHKRTFNSLSKKIRKQILVIPFEKMVTKPKPFLKKICSFLNTKETLYTPIVLEKENVPRDPQDESRKDKLNEIKKLASHDSFNLLMKMAKNYETSDNF